MKKKSHNSIMGKYSEAVGSNKLTASSKPKIIDYKPRYTGTNISKDITDPKPKQTLEEKIQSREKKVEKPINNENNKVSVEIAGIKYLIGSTEEMSEARIIKVAEMTNGFISDNKESFPGLTNSKIAILSLLDACEQILTLKDENNNLKTDLMYYKQQDIISKKSHPVDPTPMEILAQETIEPNSTKGNN